MRIKNERLQKAFKALAIVSLTAAIILNLDLTFKNFISEAKATTLTANDTSVDGSFGESKKKGPQKKVNCVYTDGGGFSISVTGVSVSNGTKKAGVEFICEKTSSESCTAISCGPAPLPL